MTRTLAPLIVAMLAINISACTRHLSKPVDAFNCRYASNTLRERAFAKIGSESDEMKRYWQLRDIVTNLDLEENWRDKAWVEIMRSCKTKDKADICNSILGLHVYGQEKKYKLTPAWLAKAAEALLALNTKDNGSLSLIIVTATPESCKLRAFEKLKEWAVLINQNSGMIEPDGGGNPDYALSNHIKAIRRLLDDPAWRDRAAEFTLTLRTNLYDELLAKIIIELPEPWKARAWAYLRDSKDGFGFALEELSQSMVEPYGRLAWEELRTHNLPLATCYRVISSDAPEDRKEQAWKLLLTNEEKDEPMVLMTLERVAWFCCEPYKSLASEQILKIIRPNCKLKLHFPMTCISSLVCVIARGSEDNKKVAWDELCDIEVKEGSREMTLLRDELVGMICSHHELQDLWRSKAWDKLAVFGFQYEDLVSIANNSPNPWATLAHKRLKQKPDKNNK